MMNTLDLLSVHNSAAMAGSAKPDIKSAFDNPEAVQVAKDFEAMMVEQILKSMRSANEVLAEDGLLSGREQKFWQDWQDSQLSIEIASGRGLGLANHILEQIDRFQGG